MFRSKMSTSIFVLSATFAHAEDLAVQKFKVVSTRTELALKKMPVIYDVQNSSRSATGRLVIPYRYIVNAFQIDIRQTNSLITPLLGEIRFSAGLQTTDDCGSIPRAIHGKAASSIEEALEISNKEECWKPEFEEPCVVTISYGYVDTKWSLQQINAKPPVCSVLLKYAIGDSSSGRVMSDVNSQWPKFLIP